ncbi:MAG: ribosome assembly cofactor RimP [Flavobacteriales bacterium]|jgi:ribosome maturation factor RimP|nr:ribosome assembly cofactor RimP [Flavobacteriales bacterium]MDA7761738.1 ribosome assembly cofactor RimP [Crocinitomicaceae bacterium]MBT5932320.1 ribosome assembly cofactor RimP [Flavobacteriales bacterium]MDA8910325.1 ribosome assembly cofactor RimP [Crocinitomicaceae bacterium]MDC0272042.1 ribosome assembly cofactor RimP [Crocinitomicaceae bacterium]
MISKENIIALIDERIKDLEKDLYVVELTISANNVIRVEVDKLEENVTVDECVSISRNIEHNLDREEEDFELHVSSAGLDKPFRHINQYKKNIGRMVKVKPLDSSKIEGLLSTVDEKGIVIIHSEKKRVEGKKKKEIVEEEFRFDFDKIKETKIVISFK